MSQKYKDQQIKAPGTVIVSATANCDNIYNVIEEPVFKIDSGSIFYINISKDNFKLGGSAFAQIIGNIGKETPCVKDAKYFVKVFNLVQDLIKKNLIVAGHDVSSGGMITSLMEMCFSSQNISAELDLSALNEKDIIKVLFSENTGIIFQSKNNLAEKILIENNIEVFKIGNVKTGSKITIKHNDESFFI